MELSLDVTNNLLTYGVSFTDEVIIKVMRVLRDNYQEHIDLIDYWSLDNKLLDDCFALTSEVRKLKKLAY